MAEVDFAVRQEWQGKGVASYLLNHLAGIAKSKQFCGFIAYVDPENQRAMTVFQNTGYVVHRSFKKGIHQISIFFNQPAKQCLTDPIDL
jgi:GNAT superfamily N-acetyltransferase